MGLLFLFSPFRAGSEASLPVITKFLQILAGKASRFAGKGSGDSNKVCSQNSCVNTPDHHPLNPTPVTTRRTTQ